MTEPRYLHHFLKQPASNPLLPFPGGLRSGPHTPRRHKVAAERPPSVLSLRYCYCLTHETSSTLRLYANYIILSILAWFYCTVVLMQGLRYIDLVDEVAFTLRLIDSI